MNRMIRKERVQGRKGHEVQCLYGGRSAAGPLRLPLYIRDRYLPTTDIDTIGCNAQLFHLFSVER